MNIHGLHKFTDMYGYGCEVTDIHGYPDVTAPISKGTGFIVLRHLVDGSAFFSLGV
jgi:hypothetical protein